MVGLWIASLAASQTPEEPAEGQPAEEPDAEQTLEVTVYGEMLVEQARQAVVEELEELGFDHDVIEMADRVVYRHVEPWRGEVVLFDDGWMQVKRQPLQVEGREVPWAKRNTPLAWAGCLIYPWACLRVNGVMVGQRKWRARETLTVTAVQPKVEVWSDRVADLAVGRKVEALPQLLEALWLEGRPIDGTLQRLLTYRDRRAALLDFWSTRTETAWGHEVRRAVEGFCRAVVQSSDHPFLPRELERFNAGREVRFPMRGAL
ncbi:MAG: hypothetical protein KTR31_09250 [Myxococcales bacterium]|nr:hypothetical protein [Myxococcales bacterium]